MRLMTTTALLAAAGLAWLLTAPPAHAQSGVSNRTTASPAARTRPSVTVRRRSYLDPGREVQPYSQHYTDYVFLNRRPLDTLGPGQSTTGHPLHAPWELGGNWRLR